MKDTVRFSYSKAGKEGPVTELGPEKKLFFKLDHFTGARFGLFTYSTEVAGGYGAFKDFKAV